MSKSKIIVIVVVIVLLVGSIIGGATVWTLRKDARDKAKLALSADDGATLGDSTSSSSVSLNSGQNSDSGGLSVSGGTGTANNLGQLTPNSLDGSSSSSNGGRTGGSAGSSSNSAASVFDPSTFKQYDKYKDAKDGLFAEVEKGTGAELGTNMKAAVYYKGWLTDGTLFDQTRTDDKGQKQPFVFTEGAHQVIPGWEQTVAGMKVGGTRLVIVPPAVGYGAQGHDPIPPNAVLIFQIQLVAVQ